MFLDPRQWHTAKAAMRFWQAVARESRVHPMTHRSVKGMFGDDQPSPLTDRELTDLVSDLVPVTQHGIILQGPRAWRYRMRRMLKRLGREPVGIRCGVAHLWCAEDVEDARQALLKADEAFLERYRYVPPTK
ncbi:MAG: hypothetical protein NTW96_27690 [Planctomycetia bacterium]|nr:hypothetical protein [Planctomycetia bacterium]